MGDRMSLTCPDCAKDLVVGDDGMAHCECGFRGFSGYIQEYEYLTARSAWLRDRLTEGAGPPDAAVARAYGVWQTARPSQPSTSSPNSSPQTVLVTVGAALLIVAALVFVAVAWDSIGAWGQIASLLTLTTVIAAAAVLSRRRAPRTAEALAAVSWSLGVICAVAAPNLGALPAAWSEPQTPYLLIVFAAATAWGVLLGHRFGLAMWTWLGWLTVPVVLAFGLALALQTVEDDQVLVTISGLAYLAAGATMLRFGGGADPWPVRTAGGVCLALLSALTVGAFTFDPPTGAVLILAAALLAAILFPFLWVAWPLAGLLLAALGLLLPHSTEFTAAAGLVGAALLFAAARTSIPLAAVSAAGLWTTYFVGSQEQSPAVMAGVVGASLLVFSLKRGASPLAWFGAALVWLIYPLEADESRFFEEPSLLLAALLLVAGLVARRDGTRNSGIIYGPALTVALIPPALMSWYEPWSEPALIRFAIVMVVGVGLLVLGARRRLLGLVIPATAAVAITATAQIYAGLDLLPRWLALAFAGAALIAIGARLEWVRERGRHTEQWLQTLR